MQCNGTVFLGRFRKVWHCHLNVRTPMTEKSFHTAEVLESIRQERAVMSQQLFAEGV